MRTENANLRSGVQTKIQLKSALRSTLAPDKGLRSTMSERSFIVRRGIFELLPVLSVCLNFVLFISLNFNFFLIFTYYLFYLIRFARRSTASSVCPTSFYLHFASSKRLKSHLQPSQLRPVHWLQKQHCW